MGIYYKMLAYTDPQRARVLNNDSGNEKEVIQNFISFYTIFSEERISENVSDLYAENAYFRNGFRELLGIENIESFFLSAIEVVHECSLDFLDVIHQNGEYYFRWIMRLTLKRDKRKIYKILGMSHVRFNQEGKIIFQQDFWDTGRIYQGLPILGSIIRWIKNRI